MSLAEAAPITVGQTLQPSPAIARLDGDETPRAAEAPVADLDDGVNGSKKDPKGKKRGLFGFGKKKMDESQSSFTPTSTTRGSSSAASPPLSRDASKLSSAPRSTASPTPGDHSFALPSSPSRGLSGSPRLASPAGSQIFERDVQDSMVIMPSSPAIPSHIQTENHIPPVLDASSEAITDTQLDPDSVEIITHASHQPAAVTVAGIGASSHPSYEQLAASWAEELGVLADREDSASNYGSLDAADVRRLSFISFADVVQAEQGGHAGHAGSRDSIHLAGLTSLSSVGINRSPSPIRSPVSSQGGPGTSPPTSNPGSIKGVEMSPHRKPLGSPTTTGPHTTGELNIETMSQALRRTGSADLSGVRSLPTSPVEGPSR